MDGLDKKLKGLLNHELEMSGIVVSEELIKRTLSRAEETYVVTEQDKVQSLKKWMKGLLSAAAMFLAVYIGFNLLGLNTKFNMDMNLGNNKNENSSIMNLQSDTDTEIKTESSVDGGSLDNSGSEGGLLSEDNDLTEVPGAKRTFSESEAEDMSDLMTADEYVSEENDVDDDAFYGIKEYIRNLNINDIVPDKWGSFEAGKTTASSKEGWTAIEGNDEIVFTITFSTLSIVYDRILDGSGGQFEVYIDGVKEALLDSSADGIKDEVISEEVYTSDMEKEHTVMIKKASDSTGAAFTILEFIMVYYTP